MKPSPQWHIGQIGDAQVLRLFSLFSERNGDFLAGYILQVKRVQGTYQLASPVVGVVPCLAANSGTVDELFCSIAIIQANGVFTAINVSVASCVASFAVLSRFSIPSTFWVGGSVHVCACENMIATIPTIGICSLFETSDCLQFGLLSMLAVICDRKNLHGEYVFWISLVDIYLGHVMDHALALKSSTDYPTLLQKSVTEENEFFLVTKESIFHLLVESNSDAKYELKMLNTMPLSYPNAHPKLMLQYLDSIFILNDSGDLFLYEAGYSRPQQLDIPRVSSSTFLVGTDLSVVHRVSRSPIITSLIPFDSCLFIGACEEGVKLISNSPLILVPSNSVVSMGASPFYGLHKIPLFNGIVPVFYVKDSCYRSVVISVNGLTASIRTIIESASAPVAFGINTCNDEFFSFDVTLFPNEPVFMLPGPGAMLFVNDIGGLLYIFQHNQVPALSSQLQSNRLQNPQAGFVITDGRWIHSSLIVICGHSELYPFVMFFRVHSAADGHITLAIENTLLLHAVFANEMEFPIIPENIVFDRYSDNMQSINMLVGFRSPGGYLLQLSYSPNTLSWSFNSGPFMVGHANLPVEISMGDSLSDIFCICYGESMWILPISSVSNGNLASNLHSIAIVENTLVLGVFENDEYKLLLASIANPVNDRDAWRPLSRKVNRTAMVPFTATNVMATSHHIMWYNWYRYAFPYIQLPGDGRVVTALLAVSYEILFVGFSVLNKRGAVCIYENGACVSTLDFDSQIISITAIPETPLHFLLLEVNQVTLARFLKQEDAFTFSFLSIFKSTHSLVSLDILKGFPKLMHVAVATRANGILILALDSQTWQFSASKYRFSFDANFREISDIGPTLLVKFINDHTILPIESFSSKIALRSTSDKCADDVDLYFPELIASIGLQRPANGFRSNSFLVSTWTGSMYEVQCVNLNISTANLGLAPGMVPR
ncbi:hypothetical protein DI09_76p30 [Mitosporidium daphniae]|uniref:Uncharacterized protein n=1 Tax=Mitosporidium daphniae TaxID=1485682 RepID=A0A098VNH6_9MICR|nr:uncharacterized protein DI09_76p30 [Mitosporidium daphniae]KGG50329.1 hypothetical protein DI09_76p30 [Mitosporidium daphniae]|eukprot:XP_013236770.1 uncharacterized protein DI09_76p30 [Mitosporidium daphniae]